MHCFWISSASNQRELLGRVKNWNHRLLWHRPPPQHQLVVFHLPFTGTHSSMILFSTHLFTCLPSPPACICLTGITTCQLPAQCQHVPGPWWMSTVRAACSAARPSGWVCGLASAFWRQCSSSASALVPRHCVIWIAFSKCGLCAIS